ncbi:MAG: methylated-DNA--[protein]-cysteine S-methyltransferase [Dermatophilaceae bacterium]
MNPALTARLRAFPIVGQPPTFGSTDVSYAVHQTPVGPVLLACTDAAALVVSRYVADDAAEDAVLERIGTAVSPRILRRPGALDAARRQLDEFLAGRRRDFDLPLDLRLTSAFQSRVLQTLARRVDYGDRASYGALAGWVEQPRAARAVGAALRGNPLCVVLPCHRVVGASGRLTGYAGGLAAKTYLLNLEARTTGAADHAR